MVEDSKENVRTSYVVISAGPDAVGGITVTSRGVAERTRVSNGAVWKEYTQVTTAILRYVSAPQLSAGSGWQIDGHIGTIVGTDGSLFGYGDNRTNRILGGNDDFVSVPRRIDLPSGVSSVKKAFTSGQGASALCIIGSDNKAYCRGNAGGGEVASVFYGRNSWFGISPIPASDKVIDIMVNGQGDDNICVLTDAGRAYCVGDNTIILNNTS